MKNWRGCLLETLINWFVIELLTVTGLEEEQLFLGMEYYAPFLCQELQLKGEQGSQWGWIEYNRFFIQRLNVLY